MVIGEREREKAEMKVGRKKMISERGGHRGGGGWKSGGDRNMGEKKIR